MHSEINSVCKRTVLFLYKCQIDNNLIHRLFQRHYRHLRWYRRALQNIGNRILWAFLSINTLHRCWTCYRLTIIGCTVHSRVTTPRFQNIKTHSPPSSQQEANIYDFSKKIRFVLHRVHNLPKRQLDSCFLLTCFAFTSETNLSFWTRSRVTWAVTVYKCK